MTGRAHCSEPNDWNLARRAWDAGVRFTFVARETATLHAHSGYDEMIAELVGAGLPPEVVAYP